MLQVALVQAAAWTNMTVYDVLPQDCRHTVTEKDVGNPAGDAYVRALCLNPRARADPCVLCY